MAISLYDLSVASYQQTLSGVAGFLEKGRAHLTEAGHDLDQIVETRLHADMFPFRFQVISVAHHSRGAIEGARAGVFRPPPGLDLNYTGLQRLVAEAQAALQALSPAEVNSLEGRPMVFELGERKLPFPNVETFLMSFSLPNFYFHATTAYDILRQAGAPLGKGDFLALRSRPAPVT